ncbi:MAG: hypothetical protein HQL97_02030 [Magnetococcales bacterium]|nr:hypothetical protein [Magnetococcales bacterium]
MKDNGFSEHVNGVAKNCMHSVCELQRINDRTIQNLISHQLESSGKFALVGARQMNDINNNSDMLGVSLSQAAMVTHLGKMMISNAKRSMSVLDQAQSDLKDLIEHKSKDWEHGVNFGAE